jgi:phage terminase large subunit-like protein
VRSDRTAIAVIGIDPGGSKYLLDGYCHRMKFSERWAAIKALKQKWEGHPGVQMVRIGYEQYGMVDDISVMKEMMRAENSHFEIVELKTPETGGHSKHDRIDRLEPDIRNGRFYLPCVVHDREWGGLCYWSVWTEEHARRAETQGKKTDYNVGQIIYRKVQREGLTARQIEMARRGMKHRIVSPLKRRDENGDIYDLTGIFIEEAIRHPFAGHDDLIDAASRIYDINPYLPQLNLGQSQSTESLEMEMEMDELGPMA